jgi:succinate-semialdehyde dehydrogenase
MSKSEPSSSAAGETVGHCLPGIHPTLFRQRACVGGEWIEADSGAQIPVRDPATGEPLGVVPNLGLAETRRAIAAAAAAQATWSRRTVYERAEHLHGWARGMQQWREDLARLMTFEQGKPLAEARGEIDYARSFLSWFAEEAKRGGGEVIASHLPGKRLFALRTPIGVTAAVTPWNFPSAMITRKAGAALAAGCAMIVRPASEAPYSALALAVLAEAAGIPAGVFSVLTGDPQPITRALLESTQVRHLSFTGSTEVGRLLMRQSADTVKRVAMELGGHAPFIVFDDADLELAVAGAVSAKFQTTGQDCLAANRIYVQRRHYDEFCTRFALAAGALKVGNGFEAQVQIGPLIGLNAVRKCREHVDDAIAKGARLLTGGTVHPAGPLFFTPTVLADATAAMRIFREETFGPVAPVCAFDDEAEVVRSANDTEFGLAAYCYGSDLRRLWRTAEQLEYGMIGVNTAKMTGPPIPFGGVKQSGLGREGARAGLEEYLETRYVCVDGVDAN